jgi:hypothetical protein
MRTMLQRIYLDSRMHKHLELLYRSGKKAALAAGKVEEIITRLQSGEDLPAQVGTVTRHGELRIKGVMKYDLGSGYRLVAFRQGKRFFLLFAGSHDDCHRWIENNRELSIDQIEQRCAALPVQTVDEYEEATAETVPFTVDDDDDDPLDQVSEQDLRRIFCGLVVG